MVVNFETPCIWYTCHPLWVSYKQVINISFVSNLILQKPASVLTTHTWISFASFHDNVFFICVVSLSGMVRGPEVVTNSHPLIKCRVTLNAPFNNVWCTLDLCRYVHIQIPLTGYVGFSGYCKLSTFNWGYYEGTLMVLWQELYPACSSCRVPA